MYTSWFWEGLCRFITAISIQGFMPTRRITCWGTGVGYRTVGNTASWSWLSICTSQNIFLQNKQEDRNIYETSIKSIRKWHGAVYYFEGLGLIDRFKNSFPKINILYSKPSFYSRWKDWWHALITTVLSIILLFECWKSSVSNRN